MISEPALQWLFSMHWLMRSPLQSPCGASPAGVWCVDLALEGNSIQTRSNWTDTQCYNPIVHTDGQQVGSLPRPARTEKHRGRSSRPPRVEAIRGSSSSYFWHERTDLVLLTRFDSAVGQWSWCNGLIRVCTEDIYSPRSDEWF